MVKIDRALIQDVRDRTGMGLMDCRKALEDANGDVEAAVELLRKKGAAIAAKRAGKETAQGIIHAYIHPGSQIGVMVEINCETDFVARTPDVQQFAQDLCMHIAALRPLYLDAADVDAAFLTKEREIAREQLATSGKPAAIVDKIVEGKIEKLYSDVCLLKQSFVKNDKFTVAQILEQLMGKTGEKVQVRRFVRFEIGA